MKIRMKLIIGVMVAVLALTIVPFAASAQQGPPDRPQPAQALMRALINTAAETLEVSPEALMQALRQGKTPAQLAAEANVDADELAAAMQATWNAQGEQLIAKFIEKGPPAPRNAMHRSRQQHIIRRWVKISAQTLQMPIREFARALRSGQTPAQIAEAHDSSGQALVDAVIAVEKARIEQAVADGKITPERGDELLAKVTEHATRWVETTPPPKPPRQPR